MASNRIRINDQVTFEIAESQGKFIVNGQRLDADIAMLEEGRFHVLFRGRSYQVELLRAEPGQKAGRLRVNGHVLTFSVEDRFEALLEQLGMGGMKAHPVNDLKAPMPGLVLKILVHPGSAVKKGDNLLVLEAMKMENIIKSPGDAVVRELGVKPGQSVEKNQLLIRFDS
ncbi:MAG: biotin/lipoyl-containing protein [Solitalea sp.]